MGPYRFWPAQVGPYTGSLTNLASAATETDHSDSGPGFSVCNPSALATILRGDYNDREEFVQDVTSWLKAEYAKRSGLTPARRSVMLTVFYRYHYYIEKALGNLLGLAQSREVQPWAYLPQVFLLQHRA